MILERGILVKHIPTGAVGVVVSLDPPTACCGYESCGCDRDKYYTPMAKVLWQTGGSAGKETATWALSVEPVDDSAYHVQTDQL
tara:strand:- start:1733 stop:1984 length:252 start_codon:yes stop_codon:yes gene_type:complete